MEHYASHILLFKNCIPLGYKVMLCGQLKLHLQIIGKLCKVPKLYIPKFVGENSWRTICQPKLAQLNKLVDENMSQSINKDTNQEKKWKYKEKDLSSCWINISLMLIIRDRLRSNTLKATTNCL